MRDVQIPKWLLCSLILLLLVSGTLNVIAWTGNSNFRDTVAGLQAELRKAQGITSILVRQLDYLTRDAFGIAEDISDSMATTEHSQELGGELGESLNDSADASEAIGVAIGDIGEFIDGVERDNAERENEDSTD